MRSGLASIRCGSTRNWGPHRRRACSISERWRMASRPYRWSWTRRVSTSLRVEGLPNAGAGESFTLSAELVVLAVTEIVHGAGSNLGQATVTILGTGFTDDTVVELLDGSGAGGGDGERRTARLWAAVRHIQSRRPRRCRAYDVRVTNGSSSVIAPTQFEVTDDAVGELEIELALPDRVLLGSIGRFAVRFRNDGGTDAGGVLHGHRSRGGGTAGGDRGELRPTACRRH